jgi:hypothetical protein
MAESKKELANGLFRSLRRWRQLSKLRRIAIAAVARRVEAHHPTQRLAQFIYRVFKDSSEVLLCSTLAHEMCSCLPEDAFECVESHLATALKLRDRVTNTIKMLEGRAVSAEHDSKMEELRFLVDALDGIKNGVVDYTLLVASVLPPEVYTDSERIAEVFELFDLQKRKQIGARDLSTALGTDDKRCAAMIKEFDKNKDGDLDLSDFTSMLSGDGIHPGESFFKFEIKWDRWFSW